MRRLEMELKENSYSIFIERGCLSDIGRYIRENHPSCRRVAIITDDNVGGLYGKLLQEDISSQGIGTDVISVKPGEASKSLETLKEVYGKLSDMKLTREDLILTLGGGVVGDLGGFAAATYLRGIPYIQVPTTLLAQVDSSIGGKVAVDLPWGKNLVGSFYQPKAVFIDPELLKTLSARRLHDGLAEVIKYGFIKDRVLLKALEGCSDDDDLLRKIDSLIERCCSIKKELVEQDEKDFGCRMLLNFGHTFGHAVEKYFGYEKYTHGEAVAIGMARITRASEEMGITEKGTAAYLEALLGKFGLSIQLPQMDRAALEEAMLLDKKSSGDSISLVLLKRAGDAFIEKIDRSEIGKFL
jgi:3-dehydroquinate synthase